MCHPIMAVILFFHVIRCQMLPEIHTYNTKLHILLYLLPLNRLYIDFQAKNKMNIPLFFFFMMYVYDEDP